MLRILKQALTGGTATEHFPGPVAGRPEGLLGRPLIAFERCTALDALAASCPTGAISVEAPEDRPRERIMSLDYGDCIFCGECARACPDDVAITNEHGPASATREGLVASALYAAGRKGEMAFVRRLGTAGSPVEEAGGRLRAAVGTLFGRSLAIRQVDAGSCNGCEIEIASLTNPVYDIERFGVHFVASPRHADMLLVTGPVTRNMEMALRKTYEATPEPRLVVAVGACAIGGGVFGTSYASCGGVDGVVPVDAYITGCPPRPEVLLEGILSAIGRLPDRRPGSPAPSGRAPRG